MRLLLLFLTLGLAVSHAAAEAGADKPNVVYILVDNWGWGDISIQGSSVPTARIDALAAEGIRFTNFNVQNQCTPDALSDSSRGGFRFAWERWKVPSPGEPQGMAPWEYTIAELLSDSGYATAHLREVAHRGQRRAAAERPGLSTSGTERKRARWRRAIRATPQWDPEVFRIHRRSGGASQGARSRNR